MSVSAIVHLLRRGIPSTVRITIPEGLTNQEVADLLVQNGLVNREKFLKKTKDHDVIDDVLDEYQINSGAEGYSFFRILIILSQWSIGD